MELFITTNEITLLRLDTKLLLYHISRGVFVSLQLFVSKLNNCFVHYVMLIMEAAQYRRCLLLRPIVYYMIKDKCKNIFC